MRIECENCQDLIEVTVSTVVAPFICVACQKDTTTQAFVSCSDPGCYDCADAKNVMATTKGALLKTLARPSRLLGQSALSTFVQAKLNEGDYDLPSDPGVRAQAESRQSQTLCDANDMIDGESIPSSCDTATVENTTLLIEDLQQQLQDERATVIALDGENVLLRQKVKDVSEEKVALTVQLHNQADLIRQQEGHIDQWEWVRDDSAFDPNLWKLIQIDTEAYESTWPKLGDI